MGRFMEHILNFVLLCLEGSIFVRRMSDSVGINGVHDLGGICLPGLDGSGEIDLTDKVLQQWELQTHALLVILSTKTPRLVSTDELRRAVEALEPKVYNKWSYYGRWAAGMLRLIVEKGILTENEVQHALSGDERKKSHDGPLFKVGDQVRVRPESTRVRWKRPHLRVPGYIYEQAGEVVAHIGEFNDPSFLAFGAEAPKQSLYIVRFRLGSVFPSASHPADHIEVEIYEDWLQEHHAGIKRPVSHVDSEHGHAHDHEHKHGHHQHGCGDECGHEHHGDQQSHHDHDHGHDHGHRNHEHDHHEHAEGGSACCAPDPCPHVHDDSHAHDPHEHQHGQGHGHEHKHDSSHDHGHKHELEHEHKHGHGHDEHEHEHKHEHKHGHDEHHHKHEHDHDHGHSHDDRAQVEQRAVDKEGEVLVDQVVAGVLLQLLLQKGVTTADEVRGVVERLEKGHAAMLGADIVVRAWKDAAFKQRLLTDAPAAALEIGIQTSNPNARTVLRVNANSATQHHCIVCTLCSCYPQTLLGFAPAWYKSRNYRARMIREPRAVLREFGLEVPEHKQVIVHDSTADCRYMVLPEPPAHLSAEQIQRMPDAELRKLVTRDSMLGVAVL